MSKTLREVRETFKALQAEVAELDAKEDRSDDEEARYAVAIEEAEVASTELAGLEARALKVASIRAKTTDQVEGEDRGHAPAQINKSDPLSIDRSRATKTELRDAALAVAEKSVGFSGFTAKQGAKLQAMYRGRSYGVNSDWMAKMTLITESDAYRSAFGKLMSGRYSEGSLQPDELRSIVEARAASEGTASAGGYGVPITIDPTVILTAGALAAPILDIARIENVTTDAWRGVTSAGTTFAYFAEGTAVTDGTPTLAQPVITVYKASAMIPYSIEVGEDYPGFAEQMSILLQQGYVNLLAQSTMTGATGGTVPVGIFSALDTRYAAGCADGSSGLGVVPTTLGTFSGVDLRALWAAVPELFRSRSTFVMNPAVQAEVRALGNNLALADFIQDATGGPGATLLGRPIVLSDYAPAASSTTSLSNKFMVLGDFSHFVIAQRVGMTVELVQHLFSTSTGLPTGQRGWYAYSRLGHNADSANPFRILQN